MRDIAMGRPKNRNGFNLTGELLVTVNTSEYQNTASLSMGYILNRFNTIVNQLLIEDVLNKYSPVYEVLLDPVFVLNGIIDSYNQENQFCL